VIDPDESVAPAQQYVGLPASLANIGRPREEEERVKKRKASEVIPANMITPPTAY
jgi:hypothetical protein